jgi:hypothetical protein
VHIIEMEEEGPFPCHPGENVTDAREEISAFLLGREFCGWWNIRVPATHVGKQASDLTGDLAEDHSELKRRGLALDRLQNIDEGSVGVILRRFVAASDELSHAATGRF